MFEMNWTKWNIWRTKWNINQLC